MELAKSFFKPDIHEGYVGKKDKLYVDSAISDDEDSLKCNSLAAEEYDNEKTNVAEFLATFKPLLEGPFSAVIPSLCHQDMLIQNNSEEKYDEFGFLIDTNDNKLYSNNKLDGEHFAEDSQWRLQWIVQLQFDKGNEISWENVDNVLPRSDKFALMVKKGIPHSLRQQLWLRFTGALVKKESSKTTYRDIMKVANFDEFITSIQIEKDIYFILPNNACFNSVRSTGVPRLRRILRGVTFFFSDISYCHGMGVIVGYLLLFMEEEDAFWTMVAIMEDLIPASYYSLNIPGIMADVKLIRNLLITYIPNIHRILVDYDVDISTILVNWLLPAFGNVLHVKILVRIWDLFFFHGSIILLKVCFGILKLTEAKILKATNADMILDTLNDAPKFLDDIDELIRISFDITNDLTDEVLLAERKRHQAYLMVDRGTIISRPGAITNIPKQHLNRRSIRKSKSIIQLLLFGNDDENDDDIKNKNIKQTELLVNLREAILQIAYHFISLDQNLNNVSLIADYSVESHSVDHENYNNISKNRRRRAKALLDYERHDDDELGFHKNDILTIISQKDEHCWIGELNGLKGWFPAKFVELLDERSKQYSVAGDDSVAENITDLVRGTLCPAVKQIFEHGMKKPSFLGGPCHPWLFIEEAALREVERDFSSVYSRLMLCKTYRLDEDYKILTPEELLYRCIQSINQSHDEAHAQMDVKFRSLICLGLNEQVLHLWFEVLCSCVEIVQKWYHSWSFICSPGWVQIKCELRILSQFSFNLSSEWELPHKKEKSQTLKDGVRDMLVKHHLFSWDL